MLFDIESAFGRNQRILVVGDEPALIETLSIALRCEGLEAGEARGRCCTRAATRRDRS
jgi:hypothetical protein